MPSSSGSRRLPIVSIQLHVARQRALSTLPRYSKETPRTMSAASTIISAR